MTSLLSLLKFPRYLTPSPPYTVASSPQTILTCTRCHTHLCHSSCIISKTFTGRHGRAYLLTSSSFTSESVTLSAPQQRQLVTGLHTVSDFRCRVCGEELGWRYDAAEEKSQRYKVGKWILERERVRRVAGCEGVVESEVERLLEEMVGEDGGWEEDFKGV